MFRLIIIANTAGISGTIISDGNPEILERGVCWSTNTNPSLDGARLHKAIDPTLPPPIGFDEPVPPIFTCPQGAPASNFQMSYSGYAPIQTIMFELMP